MPLFNTNPENNNVIAMPVAVQIAAVGAPVLQPAAPETNQEAAVEKKEGKKQLKTDELL